MGNTFVLCDVSMEMFPEEIVHTQEVSSPSATAIFPWVVELIVCPHLIQPASDFALKFPML